MTDSPNQPNLLERLETLSANSSIYPKTTPDLRKQINRALIDREPASVIEVFHAFKLDELGIHLSSFYRYARRVRNYGLAFDFAELVCPHDIDLDQALLNGFAFRLLRVLDNDEADIKLALKLCESRRLVAAAKLALARAQHLQHTASLSADRTGRASAGPESAQQPTTCDESPSTFAANNPQSEIPNPQSTNPYHLPDYLTTEEIPLENLDPKNWHPIAKQCYEELWEFQKKMCIEQKLIPEECASLPPPDPATILSMPTFPDGYFSQPPIRARGASPGPVSAQPPAAPDAARLTSEPINPPIRARGASPGPVSAHSPATPDASPSTHDPDNPQSRIYLLRQVPFGLKPKLQKIEDRESPWARLSDGTPMTHAEFVLEFREICYHRFPGVFMEPTDDEKALLKKNPSYWLWSPDPMKRAYPYGRHPDKSPRNYDDFLIEVAAHLEPSDNVIAQPPSRILNHPDRIRSRALKPEHPAPESPWREPRVNTPDANQAPNQPPTTHDSNSPQSTIQNPRSHPPPTPCPETTCPSAHSAAT